MFRPVIRAIGFDIGGVLLGSERPKFISYIQQAFGVPIDEIQPVLDQHIPLLEKGSINLEQFWKLVSKSLGVDYRPQYLELWNRHYEADSPINQEVMGLAVQLQRRKYKVGLLSNTHSEHVAINRHRHIFDHFYAVLLSNEIHARKPEPAAYHQLCRALKSQPRETVFIDDLAINVDGAVAVGLIGIKFAGTDALVRQLKILGVRV
jgi:putative hydrolase of the HAD superfamily